MAYGTRGHGFGFGYQLTPVVKGLLIANGVAFVLTLAIGPRFVWEWFGFQRGEPLRWVWTAFTYMFVHGGFWHVALNMLALFFFGPPLEGRWGGREFLRFYVIAGLGGALFSVLLGSSAPVVGASAAVYGVMLAFAMNWPDSPIYVYAIFPVKAKWLVGFLFLVTLFGTFDGPGGAVAHFAHLGGLVTGFLYLKMDWRADERLRRLKKRTRKVRRLAIVPREEEGEGEGEGTERGSEWSGDDERRLLNAVDRVLDKISREGMASLTAEEKRVLDEAARRHRTN